ncbi:hypothetical protein NBH08_15240 [Faecalicatena sp. BF-R-105]|nr:hypothetical protein [Faecalicatena sp. BF-R-105]
MEHIDKSPARKKLFLRRAFVSNSQIFGSVGEGTGQNRLPQAPGAMEYQKKREKSRHAPFTRLFEFRNSPVLPGQAPGKTVCRRRRVRRNIKKRVKSRHAPFYMLF